METETREEITKELKELETKINGMLMDFKIKYHEDASYDIEAIMPHKDSRNDRIKLTPTFRIRGTFMLIKDSLLEHP